MTAANIYWSVWFVVGFGGYEAIAIFSGHDEKTLTHAYCRLFAMFPSYKGTRFWRIRRVLGASFVFWLLLHVLTMTVGGMF